MSLMSDTRPSISLTRAARVRVRPLDSVDVRFGFLEVVPGLGRLTGHLVDGVGDGP